MDMVLTGADPVSAMQPTPRASTMRVDSLFVALALTAGRASIADDATAPWVPQEQMDDYW